MTTLFFNSDQIGIPLYDLPKDLKKKLIDLVESHGFHEDYSVGLSYFSINFKLKLWFTHETNKYYPDLPIENKSNPFPEIKKFFLKYNATTKVSNNGFDCEDDGRDQPKYYYE